MTDYKASGVDRAAAQNWVEDLGAELRSSFREEILSKVGGFGASFVSPKHYQKPVWVATTDGVGTKLLLAEEAGDSAFFGIGIDLVAMCVNDLLACRAEPLVFLDYLATDKLRSSRTTPLLRGVVEACRQSKCSLIGGETAEMPGFYPNNRLDVAGFAIGVIEREKIWKKEAVGKGDVILGMASSGFHSNGYSLIRKVMQQESWSLDTQVEGQCLGDFLLTPTKLYIQDLYQLLLHPVVKAGVHITGGGLVENLPRVFDSEKCRAKVNSQGWKIPSLMQSFCERAKIQRQEAFSTWNMGVGFCFIVESKEAEQILNERSPAIFRLGEIRARDHSNESVEIC